MGADVLFDLRPIPVVVANLFTGSTNRQQSSQGFNVSEGISQLLDKPLALLFQLLLLGDIQRNADTSCNHPDGVAHWLDIGTKRPLLEDSNVAARITLERSEMCRERRTCRFQREILRRGCPNDPLWRVAQRAKDVTLLDSDGEI